MIYEMTEALGAEGVVLANLEENGLATLETMCGGFAVWTVSGNYPEDEEELAEAIYENDTEGRSTFYDTMDELIEEEMKYDSWKLVEKLVNEYKTGKHFATLVFRVYGQDGHRQKESFCESYRYDFSEGEEIRIIDVRCSDKTGTNLYTEVAITCATYTECIAEIEGQISDGIFENQRTGGYDIIGKE